MSKKKAIAFGLKTVQNPTGFAGVIGVFLEIIIGVSILMLVMSPLFIWMYGFESIWAYAIIVGILLVIGLFIFYEPSKSSKKYKFGNRKSKIKKEYSKTRKCPHCGKLINKKAIRCKYCKTMLKKY